MENLKNSLKGNKTQSIIRIITVLDDRRQWKNAFRILRENDFPPKNLYSKTIHQIVRAEKKFFQTCKPSESLATMEVSEEIPLGYTPTKRKKMPRKKKNARTQ